MNLLYVVGEAHFDIDGYKRLEQLVAALQPAVVGIEATERDFKKMFDAAQHPNAVQSGIGNWKRPYQHSNTHTVELLVTNLVNETLLLGHYLQEGRLLFCDNPAVIESKEFEHAIASKVRRSPELKALVGMSPEQLRQTVAQEYAEGPYPVSGNLAQFYSVRDEYAEQVLRGKLPVPLKSHVLYVCGLDHLYGDYFPNLFDRLADLNPIRMKLSDADRLPAIQ